MSHPSPTERRSIARERFIAQWSHDLLVVGNDRIIWPMVRSAARNLVVPEGVEALVAEVNEAYQERLDVKERNNLRREILEAQRAEGLI